MSKLQPGKSIDWRFLKGRLGGGKQTSDPTVIGNPKLRKHFSRHNPTNSKQTVPRVKVTQSKFRPITEVELMSSLAELKTAKAPGEDGLSAEMLSQSSPKMLSILLRMFNMCLATGEVPRQFRNSLILPIFKERGKDPNLPDSYRPIPLTSVISKLLEKILIRRIRYTWSPHPDQYAYSATR
eukprot:Tbor_TRINITY_DN3805_c0_g1::TRINITY_DN3805_c0_g1_i1::g.5623::m.5623